MSTTAPATLFSALLRRWRTTRGLSQLELSGACGVSTRHLSYLETGRARPSRGMVLRLGQVLDVPLREVNELLRAAGLEEAYDEPGLDQVLAGPIGAALDRMLEAHEPFPMMVMNRRYDLLRANAAGGQLFEAFVADPSALGEPPNLYRALFDPRLARPFIEGWPQIARDLLLRLHREALGEPRRPELAALLEEMRALAGPELAEVDVAAPSSPCFELRLRRGELALRFFATVTVFSAPQDVTVEGLRIESYFPADETTRAHLSAR